MTGGFENQARVPACRSHLGERADGQCFGAGGCAAETSDAPFAVDPKLTLAAHGMNVRFWH